MVCPTNGTDPNWYLDSGATDHITGELEKLTMLERYKDNHLVWAANGASMDINHIGKSIIPTTSHPLDLNHVLHVPRVHKHLVSIHHFNLDNHTFIELHSYFFLIKDQIMKRVLLCGPSRGGLYPLLQLSSPTHKLITSAILPSSQWWHYHLGHPSRDIVLRVLKNNNMLCSGLAPAKSHCDTCLRTKAHELPYSRSTSKSVAPL
jgi:hypothetical protein